MKEKKAFQILLSRKDEFVPDTHIGIYALITSDLLSRRDEKFLIFKENEETANKMRLATFNAVKEDFRKTQTFDFAHFFNSNINKINDLGMNHFYKNRGLREILHLIEAFQVIRETPKYKNRKVVGKQTRKYVSFAIKKELLQKYVSTLEKTGEIIPPKPVTFEGNGRREHTIFKNRWYVQMQSLDSRANKDGIVFAKGVKTPIYDQFCIWAANKNVSKQQGLEMALELLLKEYPLDKLPTKEFLLDKRKATVDYIDIDTSMIKINDEGRGYVHRTLNISTEDLKVMLVMLDNYNKDPVCVKTGKLNLSGIFKMCFTHFCNTRKDFVIRYGYPEKFKELMELKKIKEYNESVTKTKET